MKTILLFTQNFDAAQVEVKKFGGHITQKFTDSIFVANLPDAINPINLTQATSQQPSKLDELSILFVNAWNESVFSTSASRKKDTDFTDNSTGLDWGTEGFQHPKNPQNDEQLRIQLEEQKKTLRLFSTTTSETMTGSITVGLIIVSGSGSGLNFSNAEIQTIVTQVSTGCQFLATAGQRYNVTFVFDTQVVTINATPNPNCASYESCEAIYRDPALQQLGYSIGYAGCVNYVNALITKHKTQWGYVAFFTKYPVHWFAYAGGVRLCMQYANDGWGPNNINKVFAHETCHIFGTADEYASSGCTCAGSGKFNVPNFNCDNCNEDPNPKQSCLMKQNDLIFCEWTKGQLGWSYWSGDQQVPGTGISGTPGTVLVNNSIYLFHNGVPGANTPWYNVLDLTNNQWSGDQQVPGTGMSYGPSAVLVNNSIYLFHNGVPGANTPWYNVLDLTNNQWSGDQQVPGTGMDHDPSAVLINNSIYLFHNGVPGANTPWYNVLDLTNNQWSGDQQVPGTGMSYGPSAVLVNNSIYLFHNGVPGANTPWYNVLNLTNNQWSGDQQVPGTGISGTPGTVLVNNSIYLFHNGVSGANTPWYNVLDLTNNQWSGDQQVPGTGMSWGPNAVLNDSSIYLFHDGEPYSNTPWYNTLNLLSVD